jgi:uncharacterized protein YkvS
MRNEVFSAKNCATSREHKTYELIDGTRTVDDIKVGNLVRFKQGLAGPDIAAGQDLPSNWI